MKHKDELLEMIKEDPIVKEYKRLEEIINTDKTLLHALLELQNLQQQLINLKTFEKHQMASKIEMEYNEKRRQLEQNPVLDNYLTLQEEVNELIKHIEEIFDKGLILSKNNIR